MRLVIACLVALVLVASGGRDADASETFVCADGRLLAVTPENRERLRRDPCIRDWSSRPVAAAPAKAATSGVASPGRRVTTPAERTVNVTGYTRADGVSVSAHRRSPRGTSGGRGRR